MKLHQNKYIKENKQEDRIHISFGYILMLEELAKIWFTYSSIAIETVKMM